MDQKDLLSSQCFSASNPFLKWEHIVAGFQLYPSFVCCFVGWLLLKSLYNCQCWRWFPTSCFPPHDHLSNNVQAKMYHSLWSHFHDNKICSVWRIICLKQVVYTKHCDLLVIICVCSVLRCFKSLKPFSVLSFNIVLLLLQEDLGVSGWPSAVWGFTVAARAFCSDQIVISLQAGYTTENMMLLWEVAR